MYTIQNTQDAIISRIFTMREKLPEELPKILQNLFSVSEIQEFLARKLNVTDISHTIQKNLNRIIKAGSGATVVEDKLPEYIESGRNIRQTVDKIKLYCDGKNDFPVTKSFNCEVLEDWAHIAQIGAASTIESYLPQDIGSAMRAKVIGNVFSEQFPLSGAPLLP